MTTTKIRNKLLISLLKEQLPDYHKYEIQDILEGFTALIEKLVTQGVEIQMENFGTFRPTHRKARKTVHPQNGTPVEYPAMTNLAFISSRSLNKRVSSMYNEQQVITDNGGIV